MDVTAQPSTPYYSLQCIEILPDVTQVDSRAAEWRPTTEHIDPDPALTGATPVLVVAREEYVPLRVAREKLQDMCAEIAKTKSQHVEVCDMWDIQSAIYFFFPPLFPFALARTSPS